jgi:hypothetical protein
MEWAATHQAADFFEVRRTGQALPQYCDDPVHTLAGKPLLAIAEQLIAAPALKEKVHH